MNVEVEIFIIEWVFSLFSSVIPLEVQIHFYEGFFVEGWKFFYKMCISIILRLNLEKQRYIDAEEIYIALKLGKYEEVNSKDVIKLWKQVINNAFKLDIDL